MKKAIQASANSPGRSRSPIGLQGATESDLEFHALEAEAELQKGNEKVQELHGKKAGLSATMENTGQCHQEARRHLDDLEKEHRGLRGELAVLRNEAESLAREICEIMNTNGGTVPYNITEPLSLSTLNDVASAVQNEACFCSLWRSTT